jgi:hypothetical protein
MRVAKDSTDQQKADSPMKAQPQYLENPKRVNNFGRFFVTMKRLSVAGDAEEFRRQLVRQYTGGRTDSMREMTLNEYNAMCYDLEHEKTTVQSGVRRLRHLCLQLMADIGLDTADWDKVNAFCRNPRISGLPFARLKEKDLKELHRKLHSIKRKGGLRVNFKQEHTILVMHITSGGDILN